MASTWAVSVGYPIGRYCRDFSSPPVTCEAHVASPIGRVSDRVARAIEVFQLFTGYLVIASEGLDTTYVIDADMRLLEVTPGLGNNHLLAVLEDAHSVIGSDSAATSFATQLGWNFIEAEAS